MNTVTDYKKGDYVLVQVRQHEVVQIYDGKPPRIGNILRMATAAEATEFQNEQWRRKEAYAAHEKRTAQQDWRDASFIAGMLDNEREKAISILGAAKLREIAGQLGKSTASPTSNA